MMTLGGAAFWTTIMAVCAIVFSFSINMGRGKNIRYNMLGRNKHYYSPKNFSQSLGNEAQYTNTSAPKKNHGVLCTAASFHISNIEFVSKIIYQSTAPRSLWYGDTSSTILKMTKFRSIVLELSLYLGSAAAAGCYPVYTPGGTYSRGSAVSQTVTVTTPIVYTVCLPPSATCVNGYTQTGGVTTSGTNNYVCSSDDWCGNVGYAPGGIYSDLAWTKDGTPCSASRRRAHPPRFFTNETLSPPPPLEVHPPPRSNPRIVPPRPPSSRVTRPRRDPKPRRSCPLRCHHPRPLPPFGPAWHVPANMQRAPPSSPVPALPSRWTV